MKHFYLSKFALLNIGAFTILGWFWSKGLLQEIFESDISYMSFVIVAVFLFGLFLSLIKLISLERLKKIDFKKEENFRIWMSSKITSIRFLANNLVLLGLIGTLIGFKIAFSGIDPSIGNDTEAAGRMISQVLSGMSVALYTTLVGTVAHIWLYFMYKLLEFSATNKYIELTEK